MVEIHGCGRELSSHLVSRQKDVKSDRVLALGLLLSQSAERLDVKICTCHMHRKETSWAEYSPIDSVLGLKRFGAGLGQAADVSMWSAKSMRRQG